MNKWDLRMLRIAREVSQWSKDKDRKVGCVITTTDFHILSTGYNGYPKFVDDSNPDNKLFKMIHAEVNALIHMPKQVDEFYAYIYGGHPCAQCAAILLQAGCVKFVVPRVSAESKWFTSMTEARSLIKAQSTYEIYEHKDL